MGNTHRKEDELKGISRREFLKKAGLAAGVAAAGSITILNACSTSTITSIVTKTVTAVPPGSTTGTDSSTATYSPSTTTSATPTTATATTITQTVAEKAFPGTVVLGRPENHSVTLSLLTNADCEYYIEYGKNTGIYDRKTSPSSLKQSIPLEMSLTGLDSNGAYFYRIRHRAPGGTDYYAGATSGYHTQRAKSESFVFTIDADPHWDENTDLDKIKLTFQNILNAKTDFNIDLGDTPFLDKVTFLGTTMASKTPSSYEAVTAISVDRRSYFDIFTMSVPLFLVLGNHDGEQGYSLDRTENNMAIWATKARKLYYPNPSPDGFYTGNVTEEPIVGLRESYYTWEWGDALFVVLDPYWYTRPVKAPPTGWDWTLGKDQYNWLKTTLANSAAKYKFVFCHNLVGGFDPSSNKTLPVGSGNGRGGAEAVKFYEWGGLNTDGTPGFDQNRPGWVKPIHQLLVDNHVSIFFHGHDHFFGKQELDGVIYQECPQPGSISNNNHANEYGYVDGIFIGSSGHMRIKVTSALATVDYVRTYLPSEETANQKNGDIAYSYTVKATS